MSPEHFSRREIVLAGAALLPAAALLGCASDDALESSRPLAKTPPTGPSGSADALAAATRPGPVHLSVGDLDRSVKFYTQSVGLERLEASSRQARLGVEDKHLVVLHERPGARPIRGSTGLYHLALLVPRREDLARWLAHAAQKQVPLTGLSDHFVSEAIYLDDPDGHGLEIYADRPRSRWEGRFAENLVSDPLDTDDLLRTLDSGSDLSGPLLPNGTRMGHVHLRVAAFAPSVAFYRDVLGFELMATMASSAAFLAVDQYHHHIAANTWESQGGAPAAEGAAKLVKATLVLPSATARDRVVERAEDAGHGATATDTGVFVRDPSGIPLEFQVAAD